MDAIYDMLTLATKECRDLRAEVIEDTLRLLSGFVSHLEVESHGLSERIRVVSRVDGTTLAEIRCEWRNDRGNMSYHVRRLPGLHTETGDWQFPAHFRPLSTDPLTADDT